MSKKEYVWYCVQTNKMIVFNTRPTKGDEDALHTIYITLPSGSSVAVPNYNVVFIGKL